MTADQLRLHDWYFVRGRKCRYMGRHRLLHAFYTDDLERIELDETQMNQVASYRPVEITSTHEQQYFVNAAAPAVDAYGFPLTK